MFDLTLIHPKLVHFTIALFSMSVFFEIAGLLTKKTIWQKAAWLNLVFAGAAVIATVLSGLLAANNVAHNDAAHEIMETHETIGFIVLGVILLLLVWRIFLKGKAVQKFAWLYLLLGLGGVGLMLTGAYLGGEMVYIHGVAVKAVPVSEAEAGHHHEHGNNGHHDSIQQPIEHDENGPEHESHDEMSIHDHSTPIDSEGIQAPDAHKHADGSEHVHNN